MLCLSEADFESANPEFRLDKLSLFHTSAIHPQQSHHPGIFQSPFFQPFETT
jgi:hypothetical protein